MSREQEIEQLNYKIQKWISRSMISGVFTWTGIFGVVFGLIIGGYNPILKAGMTLVIGGNLWAYFCIAVMVKYYNSKIRDLNNIQ